MTCLHLDIYTRSFYNFSVRGAFCKQCQTRLSTPVAWDNQCFLLQVCKCFCRVLLPDFPACKRCAGDEIRLRITFLRQSHVTACYRWISDDVSDFLKAGANSCRMLEETGRSSVTSGPAMAFPINDVLGCSFRATNVRIPCQQSAHPLPCLLYHDHILLLSSSS